MPVHGKGNNNKSKYTEHGPSKYVPVENRMKKTVPKEERYGIGKNYNIPLSEFVRNGRSTVSTSSDNTHIAGDARAYGIGATPDLKDVFYGNTGKNLNQENLRYLITISSLSGIDALPPIPDNVTDPPILWNKQMLKTPIETWTGGGAACVGMDYINRVLMRGQFLTLVPIELEPRLAGELLDGENVSAFETVTNALKSLAKLSERLDNTSYGFNTKVNSLRYWRSVNAHMKVAMMSLGISVRENNVEEATAAKNMLPEELYKVLYNIQGENGFLQLFHNAAVAAEGAAKRVAADIKKIIGEGANQQMDQLSSYMNENLSGAREQITKAGKRYGSAAANSVLKSELGGGIIDKTKKVEGLARTATGGYSDKITAAAKSGVKQGVNDVVGKAKTAGKNLEKTIVGDSPNNLHEIARSSSFINMLKFITNLDASDETINGLPMVTFNCNGPIEKTRTYSSSTAESEVARYTTDIKKKLTKSIVESASSALGATVIKEGVSSMEDYSKELYYHRGEGIYGTLVSLTYIPNVLKSTMLDEQYTVNIRHVCVSSDVFSQARMFWTYAKLLPFVIPQNAPNQPLIVPEAPMYCMAFSKGIMNIPRGAITSLSVKSDPAFQTTEGVPTEIDISLTIQPMFILSAMPSFDGVMDGGNLHQTYLATAMFNPQSSFSMIATMCGQNTILTKFQQGLVEYFITGRIFRFWESLKGSGQAISYILRDWKSGESINLKGVTSTRGTWQVR